MAMLEASVDGLVGMSNVEQMSKVSSTSLHLMSLNAVLACRVKSNGSQMYVYIPQEVV